MRAALIQPQLLKWARERSELRLEDLAHKIPVKQESLAKWETGESKPTFKQAQKIAKALHIPFGYLYLKSPPVEELKVPDLRTIGDRTRKSFSIDLHDVISDVIRKQDWYREHLIEEGAQKLSFIGKFNFQEKTETIAQDITSILGLEVSHRREIRNWELYFKHIMNKCEDAGISVIRSGKVGTNTHRILDVHEFRGFVLCDAYAPFIFINGADSIAAQIFTLAHEVAHLWLGESGVSDMDLGGERLSDSVEIERKCNRIAAEVLVPQKTFKKRWNLQHDLSRNIQDMTLFFKVSSLVIVRRAFDFGLVSSGEYFSFYHDQVKEWANARQNKKDSGGDFYKNIPYLNGRHFTEAVLQSVYSQKTLMRDGARILSTNPAVLEKYAQRIGIF